MQLYNFLVLNIGEHNSMQTDQTHKSKLCKQPKQVKQSQQVALANQ
jgi:hypothetical protein